MSTSQLPAEERDIVPLVRAFVDEQVRPVVRELEHANTYPEALIEQMKALGVFGLVVPRPLRRRAGLDGLLRARHRGTGPRVDEPGRRDGRAQRRLLSCSPRYGTEEQRARRTCPGWPPASSGPRWRSPSPAAGPTCRPCAPSPGRDGDEWVVNGSKTWITNARRAGLIALLCKTDPAADAAAPRA